MKFEDEGWEMERLGELAWSNFPRIPKVRGV